VIKVELFLTGKEMLVHLEKTKQIYCLETHTYICARRYIYIYVLYIYLHTYIHYTHTHTHTHDRGEYFYNLGLIRDHLKIGNQNSENQGKDRRV
jgi:hypothetical protein